MSLEPCLSLFSYSVLDTSLNLSGPQLLTCEIGIIIVRGNSKVVFSWHTED